MPRLLLASASPARSATLTAAGVAHTIQVSDVDEEAALEAAAEERGPLSVEESVLILARAKAEAVVATSPQSAGQIVLGCDSLLEVDGAPMGKPGTAARATERWRQIRGREAILNSGHWLSLADGRSTGAVSRTTVRFANITDDEIDAYVATGEPLGVAGGFTIDGLGCAFVTGIDGDPHGVVGLSVPLLRDLLGSLGIAWISLWSQNGQA